MIVGLLASFGAAAQKPKQVKAATETADASVLPASAAYAELLLKKTETQSELEAIMLDYTEEFPRVKELRHMIGLIDRDIARLSKVKAAESQKLTVALGRLIVRRIDLEGEMWKLQQTYKDEHPDVKRAKRRVEIYESAISEVLN